MPLPSVGSTQFKTMVVGTVQRPNRLISPTWITTNTAYAARSAKADVFQSVLNPAEVSRAGFPSQFTNDPSNGRIFVPVSAYSMHLLTFVGVGADNETGDCRVWRWEEEIVESAADFVLGKQWVPIFLGQVRFTLSAKLGVASGLIPASARYADTIAFPTSQAVDDGGLPPNQSRFFGPATPGDTVVQWEINPVGSAMLEIELRRESIATSVNAMIREV